MLPCILYNNEFNSVLTVMESDRRKQLTKSVNTKFSATGPETSLKSTLSREPPLQYLCNRILKLTIFKSQALVEPSPILIVRSQLFDLFKAAKFDVLLHCTLFLSSCLSFSFYLSFSHNSYKFVIA